jgi:GR25 family glycosyltransferase involved in LPS biosynthesis
MSVLPENSIKKYIDHIFYINLEKRTDRREHIEKILQDYNLFDISERYVAINTPHSGIIGCSQSHLNVLKLARERKYNNILILEDDFEFIVSLRELEIKIQSLFENYPDYDVCMLSHIIQKSCDIPEDDQDISKILTVSEEVLPNTKMNSSENDPREFVEERKDDHMIQKDNNRDITLSKEKDQYKRPEFIKKVLNGQTASGYLVNSDFIDVLINLYEWSCPLLLNTNHHWLYANDMVWKGLQPDNKWYFFTPPLGKQIDGYSDNKQCFASY